MGHYFLTVRGASVYLCAWPLRTPRTGVHPRSVSELARCRYGFDHPSIGHWIEGRNQLENQKESENNARAKKKGDVKKGSHSGWKLRKRGERFGRERAISGN